MDQKFHEKLAQRAIPPPMKIVENGTFFINHGLYDGTLEIDVPNFYNVVENGSKTRISSSISPYKRIEKMDQNFEEKLAERAIPPPMKNFKNGSIFTMGK
ncbi:hypothetical protein PFBG_06144 [Plasmodium falciparum 7G8]|uniref:Uncharacterized protein n=1 Tax=Plasmodium falciparum (isolate 7G8) TaxID=57266 RepID=W7F5K2_PLAF8|nr:hypothetical protein PFBG_06144 [Plasmodium falciparum 7G8]